MMQRNTLVALAATLALLGACRKAEQPAPTASPAAAQAAEARPEIPPAEPLPSMYKPGIKWMPDSPRYQQIREQAFAGKSDVTADLDLGREHLTRQSRFRVTVKQRPDAALNTPQSWVLHVALPDGKAVDGAKLLVAGGMPQHGHGMSTQPQVSALPTPGDYRVDGLQFSMPGWWEVKVHVSDGRSEDFVSFNLIAGS